MKQQTAVDWLVEQICGDHTSEWQEQIDQAKEMEKQQIGNAYVYGSAYGINLENGLSPNNYYTETYESNN